MQRQCKCLGCKGITIMLMKPISASPKGPKGGMAVLKVIQWPPPHLFPMIPSLWRRSQSARVSHTWMGSPTEKGSRNKEAAGLRSRLVSINWTRFDYKNSSLSTVFRANHDESDISTDTQGKLQQFFVARERGNFVRRDSRGENRRRGFLVFTFFFYPTTWVKRLHLLTWFGIS
jgi:hypothetical protein